MTRKVSLTVSIPQPCTQSFNDMTPADGGRFCLHCRQTVIDFSGMTDKEVLAVISKHRGNLCGNFQSEQLNRALIAAAQPRHSLLPAAMLASLIATIIPGNSKAKDPTPAMEQLTQDHALKEPVPLLFKGQIIDSLSNGGLQGVTIALKGGAAVGTLSDAAGKFQLAIPSGATELTFQISYMGYNTKEISFNAAQLSAPITISLQPSVTDLQEIVVTGAAIKRGYQTGAVVIVSSIECVAHGFEQDRLSWWERIAHLFKKKVKHAQ